MGVLKLSKSGKAVLFVTDEGVVYVFPRVSVERYLRGSLQLPFLLFSRFSAGTSPGRFPLSSCFDGGVVGDGLRQSRVESVVTRDDMLF